MILGINPKLELNPMDNLREAWEGIL
jgi:hypothetical protein